MNSPTASPCAVCSRDIDGSFFRTRFGQTYCVSHGDVPLCIWCERVVAVPRNMANACEICVRLALQKPTDIAPLTALVLRWLSALIGPNRLREIPIALVDPRTLDLHQTACTTFLAHGDRLDISIELARGIPPEAACEAIAHEFGHVLLIADPQTLQFLGLSSLTPTEAEGFCEVIRALWIDQNEVSHPELRRLAIETNLISEYSDGFRQMWPRYLAAGSLQKFRSSVLNGGFMGEPVTRQAMLEPPRTSTRVDLGGPHPVPADSSKHRPILVLSHERNIRPEDKPAPESSSASAARKPGERPTLHLE